MTIRTIGGALAIGIALSPGCVGSREAGPVAAAQAEAASRLAQACEADGQLLRALAQALVEIDAELARSHIERAVVDRLIDPAGRPDHAALDAAIDAAASRPSAVDNPASGMTRDEAHAWLDAYARALAADGPAETRTALVESLPVVRARREEDASLLETLDDHEAGLARLAAEVLASARSLAALGDPPASDAGAASDAARALWTELLLDRMHDPEKRAAAARSLERLLTLAGLEPGEEVGQ